jgi:hypothetical protein
LRWPWGSLGVALGWPWGSLGVALGWPWGGLGVALYSTVYGFRVALGWPWGSLGWLCAALFPISAFSFQHFSFCPIVALCSPLSDFSFQLSAFQLLPKGGFDVALMCLARPVTHHASRITSGLPAQSRITNHESRITSGFSWLCPAFRCWKLDVRCSMFGVHDNEPLSRPRHLASSYI